VELVGRPAALNIARKIPRLAVDDEGNVLSYERHDPIGTVNLLVDQYETVFGETAVALSQQAARSVATGVGETVLRDAGLLPFDLISPTRILLVDDHVLFRDGIVSLIDPQPDMTVVGQAGSIREATVLARKLRPDLILMDISLPDGTGIEATQAILAELPATKIVCLTVHEDDENLFAAIRAGATGYLLKNVRAAELLKRLRGAARGEAAISPAIARRILDEFSRLPTPRDISPAHPSDLTAREVQIVQQLTRGASNREIARQLVISENTVKNHVRNVLSKLHLRSRREIASYARNHGMASPPSNSSA
jgi:two-component system NarL family response regulator